MCSKKNLFSIIRGNFEISNKQTAELKKEINELRKSIHRLLQTQICLLQISITTLQNRFPGILTQNQ